MKTKQFATWLIGVSAAAAFNGHEATSGPLTLTIGEPAAGDLAFEQPVDIAVHLQNAGAAAVTAALRVHGLVDEWHAVGPAEATSTVPAGASASTTFRIAAGEGVHDALYPVHVEAVFADGAATRTAAAVRIFSPRFKRPDPPAPGPVELPAGGGLALLETRTARVVWHRFDSEPVFLPAGWRGSEPKSGALWSVEEADRGGRRRGFSVHPPWRGGPGIVRAEWNVSLPSHPPLRLHFFNAIRDTHPSEPPSDGITFRVRVDGEPVFERHVDAKQWVPGEADLDRFAGRTVTLAMETDPGPKRDTTCDHGWWADPYLLAGASPPPPSPIHLAAEAVAAARIGESDTSRGIHVFKVEGGAAAVAPGPQGLVDAACAFATGGRAVGLSGFTIAVNGHRLGDWPSLARVTSVRVDRLLFGRGLDIRHELSVDGQPAVLTAEVRHKGPALRIRFRCEGARISDLAPGPVDGPARRVYFGHGYAIEEPGAFSVGFGGHSLSASHVGFESADGSALLCASDNPPDRFEVDPVRRLYALHTDGDATLSFVAGARGALDCAMRYRPLYDKSAAPAVKRKAGRFVYDFWGGRFSEIADLMRQASAYGLTDTLLLLHVWQRWGYDYRLPDIWPPDPRFGTVEELRELACVCASNDVPWGLHDNYIDFYPDADGYTYDHICFTADGRPVPAWLNEGRDAQSYRWRPDRFRPFLERNTGLIANEARPTASFVDVFASMSCIDYHDRSGAYHPMTETRACWGAAFDFIRDSLGGRAPTCSEAGHDQLTGHLDGADCQFLQLSPTGGEFRVRVPCRDWARVPWYDAVLHDRFILHGVGYSGRYEGGRPRDAHGIESDDYLSAEILTGHALMTDRPAGLTGAVRKYWLAQGFARGVAMDTLRDVAFEDGDVHRLHVRWSHGAEAWVNRGSNDWTVAGRTLPEFGYLAVCGSSTSAVERIDGAIVERAEAPGAWYFNARGHSPRRALAIRPEAVGAQFLDGRRFRMNVRWAGGDKAPEKYRIFTHFSHPSGEGGEKIAFQASARPPGDAAKVAGGVLEWTVDLPEACGPGEYEVFTGLWAPEGGERARLEGDEAGHGRYRLGRLIVEGQGSAVTAVRLVPNVWTPPPSRENREQKPIDFGVASTAGGYRIEIRDGEAWIIALPGQSSCAITVRPERLGVKGSRVDGVEVVDAAGRVPHEMDFTIEEDGMRFVTQSHHFGYRLRMGGR